MTVALAIACGGDTKPPQLRVTSREWSFAPATGSLKPGRNEFVLANEGTLAHELIVLKTDLPPSQLPMQNGKADEEKLHVVGRVPVASAGATGHASMVLSPGKYLLICNLVDQGATNVSHLDQGMVASITVSQ